LNKRTQQADILDATTDNVSQFRMSEPALAKLAGLGDTIETPALGVKVLASIEKSQPVVTTLTIEGIDDSVNGACQVVNNFLEDICTGAPHNALARVADAKIDYASLFPPDRLLVVSQLQQEILERNPDQQHFIKKRSPVLMKIASISKGRITILVDKAG